MLQRGSRLDVPAAHVGQELARELLQQRLDDGDLPALDIPHGDELDDVPRRDPAGRALQPLAVISIQDLHLLEISISNAHDED